MILHWLSLYGICYHNKIAIRFEKKYVKQFFGLMTWTSLNRFAYQLFFNCDAFIIGFFLGAEKAPVYMLTKRAWDMVNLLINRLGVAFMPGLAHLHGEGDINKNYRAVVRGLFL